MNAIRILGDVEAPFSDKMVPAFGIGAIVHVKNGSRSVMISSLNLSGKEYLDVDEYMLNMKRTSNKKEIIKENIKELNHKRPYYKIFWSAFPSNSNSGVLIATF